MNSEIKFYVKNHNNLGIIFNENHPKMMSISTMERENTFDLSAVIFRHDLAFADTQFLNDVACTLAWISQRKEELKFMLPETAK